MKQAIINRMQMSFPAISVNEQFARMAVAAFVAQIDPTATQLSDLKTAVSEAVTNAIVHGYRNRPGQVYLSCKLYADHTLWVRIRDTGCGIEDIPLAMTPLYSSALEEERAGLGFAVMEAFCDKIRVSSQPGKGTSVILMKKMVGRQTELHTAKKR